MIWQLLDSPGAPQSTSSITNAPFTKVLGRRTNQPRSGLPNIDFDALPPIQLSDVFVSDSHAKQARLDTKRAKQSHATISTLAKKPDCGDIKVVVVVVADENHVNFG